MRLKKGLRWFTVAITSLLVIITSQSNLLRQFFSFFLCALFSFQSTVCPAGGIGLFSPVNAQETPGKLLEGTWFRHGGFFFGDGNGCQSIYSGELANNESSGVPAMGSGVEFRVTQEGNRLIFPNETRSYSSERGEETYTLSTEGFIASTEADIWSTEDYLPFIENYLQLIEGGYIHSTEDRSQLGELYRQLRENYIQAIESYLQSIGGNGAQDIVQVTYSGGGFKTKFRGRISSDAQTVVGLATCEDGEGASRAMATAVWTRSQGIAQGSIPTPGNVESISTFRDRASFEEAFEKADVNQAVEIFDAYQTQKYQNHFGLDASSLPPKITTAEISHRLDDLYQETGVKSAFLQAVSLPDHTDLILVEPTSISGRKRNKQINQNSKNTQSEFAVREIVLGAAQDELQRTAQQFRNELLAPNRRGSNAHQQTSQKLYDWLVGPLEVELASNGIQALIVSADTGLRSLPMAALFDGHQYLIEKYSFALIPSFRLTDTEKINISNRKLLAMGISESTQGQTPLPAVGVEIDILSNQLWKGQTFLNGETTIQKLKSVIREQETEIIHLATHASFQPGDLSNSYIQFWDEKLSLSEFKALSQEPGWEAVKMIVLSACQTALGDEQSELGFTGLALQTGVETGIGTLWIVNDAASLALMAEFYSRLNSVPNKAEALRQAQLAMIHGDITIEDGQLKLSDNSRFPVPAELTQVRGMNLSHPYFWSGVTLIGNSN